MSALSTYDSPGTSTDSDLHSTGKRTTADLDIYYETTPDGGRRELFEPQLSTKAQDELKWIVDDLIPMSVVEVVSFKSFVNGINPKYVLACRKTVTRRIISTYSLRLQDMKTASRTDHGAILAFGLENKILACVSDNDESTVQGLNSVKAILEKEYGNSAFQPLRRAVHTNATSVEGSLSGMLKAVVLVRDLVVLAKNSQKFFQRISEESMLSVKDNEDNMVDSFIGHVTLKLDTETRWSSTYVMLATLLRMRNPLREVFSKIVYERSVPKAFEKDYLG
ncbi:hypothetical protein V1506DRAFT_574259 [Lipomyces tetrasporus]